MSSPRLTCRQGDTGHHLWPRNSRQINGRARWWGEDQRGTYEVIRPNFVTTIWSQGSHGHALGGGGGCGLECSSH